MNNGRRIVNIILLAVVIILGGVTARLLWLSPQPLSDSPSSAVSGLSNVTETSTEPHATDTIYIDRSEEVKTVEPLSPATESNDLVLATEFKETDIKSMVKNHPFSREAAKVLSGRLEVGDSVNRRKILNYCEHFRTSYNTKDIDFLRQLFSDNALIIVGHTVKTRKNKADAVSGSDKVRLSVQTKQTYLDRLSKVFAANKVIDVRFSDFSVMRHPTMEGIYGVTLRQKYSSDLYQDDGWLFLLWDFRDPSMPKIHVRTWQPDSELHDEDDIIGISDFNLQ